MKLFFCFILVGFDVYSVLAQPPVEPYPRVKSNETHCVDTFGNVKQPVPGRPDQCYTFFDTTRFVTPCAPGTAFEMSTCGCTTLVPVINPPSPRACLLYLPFDHDFTDKSVNEFMTDVYGNADIDHDNKARGAGSAHINHGRIEIPGLNKGIDLDKHATWCLFFRCESDDPSNPYACLQSGGLLSNNGGDNDFSFIMSADRNPTTNARVDARFQFVEPQGTATLSYPPPAANGFNQACVTYDGSVAILYINGEIIQPCSDCIKMTNNGSLAISQNSYTIGSDQIFGDFTGFIDEVLVCSQTLSPNEINAHYRGDLDALVDAGLLPTDTIQ